MKIGDEVTWTSQALGRTKTKTGIIVDVVAEKDVPDRVLFPSLSPQVRKAAGIGRKGESYVVKVGSQLYWPLAKNLELRFKEEVPVYNHVMRCVVYGELRIAVDLFEFFAKDAEV